MAAASQLASCSICTVEGGFWDRSILIFLQWLIWPQGQDWKSSGSIIGLLPNFPFLPVAGESLTQFHADLTHGRGADYVFEAAGNEVGFQTSLEIVRPGGQVVWLGKVAQQQQVSFRWGSLMGEKNIVRSSYGGSRAQDFFPSLAEAYLNGDLLLDDYVTSRISLPEINSALDRMRQGLEIRSVIEF